MVGTGMRAQSPFNLSAMHVHPCGFQVPVCAMHPVPVMCLPQLMMNGPMGRRARCDWSGASPSDSSDDTGAKMHCRMHGLDKLLRVCSTGEVTGEQRLPLELCVRTARDGV